MSELVTRIREMGAKIGELEESVLNEKRKYADEVDHSDNLAYLLSLAHNGKHCPPMCSFCNGIRQHERRRAIDYGIFSELLTGETSESTT